MVTKPRRAAIVRIGAVVDGVVIGWGFRDADVGAQLDSDGNLVHVAGWTVPELEELLRAIEVHRFEGAWPKPDVERITMNGRDVEIERL